MKSQEGGEGREGSKSQKGEQTGKHKINQERGLALTLKPYAEECGP